MKRKHVITTFALSMLLGVGVFAGIHQAKVQEAKAAAAGDTLTFYIDAKNAASWVHNAGAVVKLQTWNGTADVQYDCSEVTANVFMAENVDTTGWAGFKFVRVGNDGKGDTWDFSSWSTDFNKRYFVHSGSGTGGTWSADAPAKYSTTLSVEFAADVPDYADIYIPGGFNSWSTDITVSKMTRVSDTVFTYEVKDIYPGNYDYKIVACYSDVTVMNWDHPIDAANQTVTIAAANDGKTINLAQRSYDFATNMPAQEEPDVPAEDGYYIVGTESSWKFAGATKMAAGEYGNKAQLMSYAGKAGEEFKVRSYLNGVDAWYNLPESEENYKVGESNRTLDIFLNSEGKFTVRDHVEPPAEDGYYIVGTESSWTYEGATKMGAGEGEDKAYLRYEAKANEIFKVRSYIQGVDTWYGENYEVGEEAKVLNIYLNKDNEVYIEEYVEPDVPTEGNGYYIVGTETSWKFAGATKMALPELEENDAELLNYTGKVGEKLKVRYYNGDTGEDIYGFCKSGELAGIGEVDGDENFVFTAAVAVDIFAKWEEASENNWQINFYVTAHADRYVVTIHDVLFEGAAKVGVAEQTHTQRATAGVDFEYNLPDMNGYVARALYTDANCTTLYEKHALTGNTDLYAKYTRLGNYMTGDATYTGSQDTAWQIDGASYLTSDVNDPLNRLEGTVVIPASADKENPVVVKALQFTGINEEGKTIWAATTYELGATYTFVELDKDSNFVFSKGGTFAVYINQENKVYFNEGAAAFYTKFITDMNHVCDADGNTNTEALAAKWLEEKAAYDSLSAEEKAAIVAVGIEHGDPSGDDLHKVVASYEYIVKKYGTSVVEDFIWNGTYAPEANYNTIGMTADDTTMTVVVISAIAVISAAGLFFLIRRKRRLVK